MALSLDEIKDLIRFGSSQGLTSLRAEGIEIQYDQIARTLNASVAASDQPADENTSGIPSELQHYSAKGRAVFGKLT